MPLSIDIESQYRMISNASTISYIALRMTSPEPLKPAVRSRRPSPEVPVVLRSEDLLDGQREILIVHSDDVYRLRLTRNGKLILTK